MANTLAKYLNLITQIYKRCAKKLISQVRELQANRKDKDRSFRVSTTTNQGAAIT